MSDKNISFIEFGKIAEFRNGLNFSKDSHGTGCWLIGVGDFQKNFVPDYDSLEEVNPKGITKDDDYVKKGDILFVRSNGNKKLVGRSLYIDQNINALFSGFCIRARLINKCIDSLFLAYYTRTDHFKSSISFVAGTNINNLNQNILSNVKLPIYPKNIQLSITNVLSNIDEKIQINNRINAELETMAKTLYDYWFVQFDFPNEAGKPYKSSGGKMQYNAELKREIPDGWEVGTLGEIANITMGQSPPGESYNETGEGMIFYQGCTDFGNRFPTIRLYTTSPTRFAKSGDILLSVRAPVGTLNIANEPCCIGRGLAALNSKQNSIAYLFGVMMNLKQIFDRRNVDGTTFGSITKNDLFSLRVIKPSKEILKKYQNTIFPAFEKQNQMELENQQLAELRDWLLPMLMNGQVKVNETEKEIKL